MCHSPRGGKMASHDSNGSDGHISRSLQSFSAAAHPNSMRTHSVLGQASPAGVSRACSKDAPCACRNCYRYQSAAPAPRVGLYRVMNFRLYWEGRSCSFQRTKSIASIAFTLLAACCMTNFAMAGDPDGRGAGIFDSALGQGTRGFLAALDGRLPSGAALADPCRHLCHAEGQSVLRRLLLHQPPLIRTSTPSRPSRPTQSVPTPTPYGSRQH